VGFEWLLLLLLLLLEITTSGAVLSTRVLVVCHYTAVVICTDVGVDDCWLLVM
jgi:hypothetical protein